MNSAVLRTIETGDERVIAAAAGGVGRQLRPRRWRAVPAEGRAVQCRGEEGEDRAVPRQAPPEELQQENHCTASLTTRLDPSSAVACSSPFASARLTFGGQYACRKTLADSRLRVKGRFARNGEADEHEASDDISYEYCCAHNELTNGNSSSSCYDGHYKPDGGVSAISSSAFNCGSENGEWWWHAPGAAAADEAQRQVGFDYDDEDELWATLGDMLSVNLAS
jgi:hypothetical protein